MKNHLAALLCLLALQACRAEQLVFTTYTKVGLDISVANGTPTQAVLGYKRFEGAVVPVELAESMETKTDEKDAMSVFAVVDLENSWTKGLKIKQVFATGPAAKEFVAAEAGKPGTANARQNDSSILTGFLEERQK